MDEHMAILGTNYGTHNYCYNKGDWKAGDIECRRHYNIRAVPLIVRIELQRSSNYIEFSSNQ